MSDFVYSFVDSAHWKAKERLMLRKDFDWYTRIIADEDSSLNSIAEIQEQAPKWHPSPMPNFFDL